MRNDIDLDYDSTTFAGPFNEPQLRGFERWLQKCQTDRIHFDEDYIAHLRKYHGGVPRRRYFETARGTPHVLTRFLNFSVRDKNNPLSKYRVESTRGLIEDRLGKYLMPFAELFAGDFLCFDHSKGNPPRIVVWFHESSDENKPHVEPVAENFPDFLMTLHFERLDKRSDDNKGRPPKNRIQANQKSRAKQKGRE